MDERIKRIIFLIIAIIIAVIVVNFVLWLLPILFIGAIACYVYLKLVNRKIPKKNKKIIIEYKD